MDIDSLELTVRTTNLLKSNDIYTVEQLVSLSYVELKNLDQIGAKSLNEICWTCIQLLNGKLLERAKEWNERYPPVQSESEMKARAQAYWKANEADITNRIKQAVEKAFK